MKQFFTILTVMLLCKTSGHKVVSTNFFQSGAGHTSADMFAFCRWVAPLQCGRAAVCSLHSARLIRYASVPKALSSLRMGYEHIDEGQEFVKSLAGRTAQQNLQRLNQTLAVFESGKEDFSFSDCNKALKLCVICSREGVGMRAVNVAMKIRQVMRATGISRTEHVYGALMDICANAAAIEQAMTVLKWAIEDGISPGVIIYSSLMNSIAKAAEKGDLSTAEKVLEVIDMMKSRGMLPNKYTYSSAIDACTAAAPTLGARVAAGLARTLLQSMRKDKLSPNQIHYNSILKGCALAAKAGDKEAVSQAYQTLEEMRTAKIKPSVRTYTAMIDTLAKSQNVHTLDRTMLLLQEMWRIGIRPTRVTYNVIINAYAMAAERLNGGTRDSERHEGGRPRRARDSVGGRSVAGEVLEKAIGVLEHMREAGVSPDVWTYNTLLNACAKSAAAAHRAPRKGVRVLELMREAGLYASPDQYGVLLQACKHAEEGQTDAYALGLRIRELMCSQSNGSEVCGSDEDRGNVVGADVVDAGATWHESALRYANIVTSEGMIDASKTAQHAKSMQQNRTSRKDDGTVETFRGSNVVLPVVDAAATAARVRAIATLAGESSGAEDGEEMPGFNMGMRLLEEMRAAGLEPDTITYTAVLHAAKQEGSVRAALGARELLRRIPLNTRNHRTYAVTISSLSQMGFIDEACDVLDEARSHLEPNIFMYCALLAPLASRPDQNSVRRFFNIYDQLKAEGVKDSPLSLRLVSQALAHKNQLRGKGIVL